MQRSFWRATLLAKSGSRPRLMHQRAPQYYVVDHQVLARPADAGLAQQAADRHAAATMRTTAERPRRASRASAPERETVR